MKAVPRSLRQRPRANTETARRDMESAGIRRDWRDPAARRQVIAEGMVTARPVAWQGSARGNHTL
jgi:hypothetical protein